MSLSSLLSHTLAYYTPNYDSQYYDSLYTTPVDDAAALGVAIGVFVFSMIVGAIAYVLTAIFLAQIFKKAGIEQWKAWVPIYNYWVLLELGGQQGFWAVLSVVPIVNIVSAVFMYIAMYHIGLRFGKPDVFVLLAIFLPLVWMIWLAVDSSKWSGPSSSVPKQPSSKPSQPAAM